MAVLGGLVPPPASTTSLIVPGSKLSLMAALPCISLPLAFELSGSFIALLRLPAALWPLRALARLAPPLGHVMEQENLGPVAANTTSRRRSEGIQYDDFSR